MLVWSGVPYIVPINFTDLRYPRICDRDNLYQGCVCYRVRLQGGEKGLEVDIPIGAEPDKTLRRNN